MISIIGDSFILFGLYFMLKCVTILKKREHILIYIDRGIICSDCGKDIFDIYKEPQRAVDRLMDKKINRDLCKSCKRNDTLNIFLGGEKIRKILDKLFLSKYYNIIYYSLLFGNLLFSTIGVFSKNSIFFLFASFLFLTYQWFLYKRTLKITRKKTTL